MVTTLNLTPDELTVELLEQIKQMFSASKHIEIEIRSLSENSLYDKETKEEYKERILKAIDNVENKKKIVAFTENEFTELTDNLLK